jgi:TM2 domain-containing membrane protein YozV
MKYNNDWLIALILVITVGAFGIHRFYVGKVGTGVLWLLTGGLLGIGWLVDVITIAMGTFTNKGGEQLEPYGLKK